MLPNEFPNHLISSKDKEAGTFLRKLSGGGVDALVVLGSGLAGALDSASWPEPSARCALSDIAGVLAPVADGHEDELRIYDTPLGEVEKCASGGKSVRVAVARGRTHLYEGVSPDKVTALSRGAFCAGARTAILCNANGCFRDWQLGDVMAINDHINFSGFSPFDGTVFLDTSGCWDAVLTETLADVCEHIGTYAFMRGPEYQTRAETRWLESCGVDAVGMSTVLEALTLHALGVKVCGMSAVSDLSFAPTPTDPSDVVATARKAQKTMLSGIEKVLTSLVQ